MNRLLVSALLALALIGILETANAAQQQVATTGKRFSTWRPEPCPTSRNPVVRLSRPQTTLTGAHESDA